jgi:hypothetical protein
MENQTGRSGWETNKILENHCESLYNHLSSNGIDRSSKIYGTKFSSEHQSLDVTHLAECNCYQR